MKTCGIFRHRWKRTLIYPPLCSDGAGSCWAGHLIRSCEKCGKFVSHGIWAAAETDYGKSWARMRSARAEEIADAIQAISLRKGPLVNCQPRTS